MLSVNLTCDKNLWEGTKATYRKLESGDCDCDCGMMEVEVGVPVMEEVGRLSESLGLGLADVPILSAENRSLCGDLASLRVEARRLAAEVDQGWFQESTLIPVLNFDDSCDNRAQLGIKSFKVNMRRKVTRRNCCTATMRRWMGRPRRRGRSPSRGSRRPGRRRTWAGSPGWRGRGCVISNYPLVLLVIKF